MSTIIAAVSDTHIGGTTALCPPKFETHTGRDDKETQTNNYNDYQKWLYTCWLEFWRYAASLAGIRGKYRHNRLVVFHLGDMVEGEHHGTNQTMDEVQDQITAAGTLLKRVRDLADDMYCVYGTPAHNGGEGQHEAAVAAEIGAKIAWDWALDVDGVTFDLMHHGTAGRTDWTSTAARLASVVVMDYVALGLPPPRYTLRGHVHSVDDSGIKVPRTRAIVLPSWQLRTAHGHKASPRRRADVGGLILDTADPDNPNLSRMRYTAPGEVSFRVVKV